MQKLRGVLCSGSLRHVLDNWHLVWELPAVLALVTDNGGSSEASAKTAEKITASPSHGPKTVAFRKTATRTPRLGTLKSVTYVPAHVLPMSPRMCYLCP